MLRENFVYVVLLSLVFTGCEYVVIPSVPDCTQSTLAVVVTDSVGTLCGGADGSITILATGGQGNYQYKMVGGVYQSSGVFSGLAPGLYNFFAMDDIGCEAIVSGLVKATDGVNITNLAVVEAGCGTANGSISVTVDSSTPGITYQLDGGAFGTSSTFTGLASGTYAISVKNATGCITTGTATIKSGISFAVIKALMDAECNMAGCHAAGATPPNLTVDANIVAYADKIKLFTGNKRMPKGPSNTLTPSQIADIACWVDDGAQLN